MNESFVPKDKTKQWACGVEPIIENNPSRFELKVTELGLNPDQLVASEELKTWCTSVENGEPRYNTLYIPEILLRAWKIRTCWYDDDAALRESELFPVVPFSDMKETHRTNSTQGK